MHKKHDSHIGRVFIQTKKLLKLKMETMMEIGRLLSNQNRVPI